MGQLWTDYTGVIWLSKKEGGTEKVFEELTVKKIYKFDKNIKPQI